jgi:HAD superfamily hydrolase (TIGR01484 family)
VSRAHDALLLDLDGTLITDGGGIHPRTRGALAAAMQRGVRVMLATGRSENGTAHVLTELASDTPALVYNGAGVWCPLERRLIEERVLSNRTVARALGFAERTGVLPVAMRAGEKFSPPARSASEVRALAHFDDLALAPLAELPTEALLRVTFFGAKGARWPSSQALAAEVEAALDQPIYLTHFQLDALFDQRGSDLLVVDVQPPCRGKAEALRVLEERYEIRAARVVAVGDADNDVPMLRAAGLGVAMANATPSARAAAGRTIGDNNSDSIAGLVEELFLDGNPPD